MLEKEDVPVLPNPRMDGYSGVKHEWVITGNRKKLRRRRLY